VMHESSNRLKQNHPTVAATVLIDPLKFAAIRIRHPELYYQPLSVSPLTYIPRFYVDALVNHRSSRVRIRRNFYSIKESFIYIYIYI